MFYSIVIFVIKSIKMPKVRNSYTTERKLKAIEFAEKYGNCKAGVEYGVNESMVRKWRKSKEVLIKMKPQQRSLRTGSPHWPELESALKTWVLGERTTDSKQAICQSVIL